MTDLQKELLSWLDWFVDVVVWLALGAFVCCEQVGYTGEAALKGMGTALLIGFFATLLVHLIGAKK